MITIEDFMKVDLRTGKILEAEKIEWSNKLLKLLVKVGEEKRTILAGIANYYAPEELVGKTVVVVFNLKPKKIRDLESQGMILAVDGEELNKGVVLVTPEKEVEDGLRVR